MKEFFKKRMGSIPTYWLLGGGVAVIAAALFIILAPDSLRHTPAFVGKTFRDTFASDDYKLAAEIDLGERNESSEEILEGDDAASRSMKEAQRSLEPAAQSGKSENISQTTPPQPEPEQILRVSSQEEKRVCGFETRNAPLREVLLNEIAWTGTVYDANDEWMELKNNSARDVNLGGWKIISENGKLEIDFEEDAFPAGELYLLERTDDYSVPTVSADAIYAGPLVNSGAWLKLLNGTCELVDEINASAGWEEFGGNNELKRTLERNNDDVGWHTSSLNGGTPRKPNSPPPPPDEKIVIISPSSQSPPPPPPPPLEDPEPVEGPPPEPTTTSTAAPRVLLSEILYDAEGSDTGKEFVEFYNAGGADVNLKDWSLVDTGGSLAKIGAKPEDKLIIKSGGYFLVGLNGWNSAPSADAVRSASLSNTAETITLKDASGGAVDSVSYNNSVNSGQSFERTSWDSHDFVPQSNPSPQSSQ